MSDLRNYTLYRFEDGQRIPMLCGADPCPILNAAELCGIPCELVSPDGEVVWPEPKNGESWLERARR